MTNPASKFFLQGKKGMGALLAFWVLTACIVNPLGEFPLNDDWVYLQALTKLYHENVLFFSDWISSTLVAQLAWALVFCKIFGYKIIVVRISTFVTTLLLGIALHNLTRRITSNPPLSLLVAAVFIFSPVMYVQSFTFMTESSFNLMMVLCTYACYRYVMDRELRWLSAASLLTAMAVLIKQPALIVAFSLVIVSALNARVNRKALIHCLAFMAVPVLVYYFYMQWLNGMYGNPQHVNGVNSALLERLKFGFGRAFLPQVLNAFVVIMYIGFYCIPLVPLIYSIIRDGMSDFIAGRTNAPAGWLAVKKRRKRMVVVFIFTVALLSVAGALHYKFPCIENVIYNTGLGPILLHDTFILKVNLSGFQTPLFFPFLFALAGFAMGLTCVSILVLKFWMTLRKSIRKTATSTEIFYQFLFTAALLYIFLLVNVYMFDRYVLVFVPMGLMMLFLVFPSQLVSMPRRVYAWCFALLMPFIIYDVTATHDYMAWNRAKWKALDVMTGIHRVSPLEMDGGYEFNGIHNYDVGYVSEPGKSWWWVADDKYVTGMGPLAGYHVFHKEPYYSWTRLEEKNVFILERNP
jgi:hypothetical protein